LTNRVCHFLSAYLIKRHTLSSSGRSDKMILVKQNKCHALNLLILLYSGLIYRIVCCEYQHFGGRGYFNIRGRNWGYSKVKMDEACLSEFLACTVHIMHCRNLKYHGMNLYLLKYTGETNTGRQRCTLYKNSLNSTSSTVQPTVFRIIISYLLNDMIRSSDLDRIY
jgi:hypothetical protein